MVRHRDIEARAFLGGERRFDVKFKPSLAPRLEVQSSLYGALEIPRTIAVGLPFTASAQEGYTAGEWSCSIEGHLRPGEAGTTGQRYRPLRRYNALEIAAYNLGMDALMEQSSTELRDHAATEAVGAERGRFPHGGGGLVADRVQTCRACQASR